jgi:hypothetical protein
MTLTADERSELEAAIRRRCGSPIWPRETHASR